MACGVVAFRLRHADRIVGAFLLASLFALVSALLLVVRSHGMFKRRIEYTTVFADGGGIRPETPVRIAGIEVGSVRRVTLTGVDKVEVVFDVLEEYADRMRADPVDGSCRSISTLPMLDNEERRRAAVDAKRSCGTRVAATAPAGLGAFLPTTNGLIITPGNRENPLVPPGGLILAEEQEGIGDLIGRLQQEGIVQNARDIITQMDALLRQVNDPAGPFQRTLHHVADVTQRASEGRGLIGEVTRDNSATQQKVASALGKLDTALGHLEETSATIRTLSTQVMARSGDIQGVIDKLSSFAGDAATAGKDLSGMVKEAKDLPPDVAAAVRNLNGRIDELGVVLRSIKRTFPFNLVDGAPPPEAAPPAKAPVR